MRDNADKGRFELDVDGAVVYADYRQEGNRLIIPYVYAPPELRGKGAADKLMRQIVERAKSENQQIVPVCGYAAAWLRRHQSAA